MRGALPDRNDLRKSAGLSGTHLRVGGGRIIRAEDDKNIGTRTLFCLCLLGLTVSGIGASARSQTPATSNSNEALGGTASTSASLRQTAYIKASNTGAGDQFGAGGTLMGDAVALSADGSTLAVGAPVESSGVTGINGDQDDDSTYGAGAVYVFTHDGENWTQQAYVKASNAGLTDSFGYFVALSGDGDTLAVSAYFEGSAATGVNGNQHDDSIPQAGAVYVFARDGDAWSQQAYLKASNTGEAGIGHELGDGDQFGFSLTLSDDGNTLAVSSITEDSGAPGINGDQSDNSEASAGAVYLFTRTGIAWTQEAYIKPTNPGGGDMFGYSVSLTVDGNMLAVSGFDEDGSLASTNEQQDDDVRGAGAVYVFTRIDGDWEQTAYLKASNAEPGDSLGVAVAISDDGNTLVAGSLDEDGTTTGINSTAVPDRQTDASTGAVYVFVRDRGTWSQQAYIKASNTSRNDWFGSRLTLSGDGNTLAVGAQLEDSAAQGINANQDDETAQEAGAVYLFTRDGTTWTQSAYVKGANTEAYDEFGSSVALSRDGALMAVGARGEDSAAARVDGEQSDNSAYESGAVYVFSRPVTPDSS